MRVRGINLKPLHPIIKDPARSHAVDAAAMSTFKESIIDLKIWGTWTFRT